MNDIFNPRTYLRQQGIKDPDNLTPAQAVDAIQRLCSESLRDVYSHMSPEYYLMVLQAIDILAKVAARG